MTATYKTFEGYIKNTEIKNINVIRVNHDNIDILHDLDFIELDYLTIEVKNKVFYIGFELSTTTILYAIPQEIRRPAEKILMNILAEEDEEESEEFKIGEEKEMASTQNREEHEEEIF